MVKHARKQARKPRATKRKTTRVGDVHTFKLQADNTVINNVVSGSVIVPKGNGDTFIGQTAYVTDPTNTQRWQFGGSFAFNATQTLQWSQLNTLFDRYKVNRIHVRFIPENNYANVNGGGVVPTIRVAHDYDDNQIPSVGDIWSRRAIERRLDRPFAMSFKPRMLGLVYRTATTQGSSPQPCKFIDCAQGDVPLFGLKYAVKDWYVGSTVAPNTMVLRMEITYEITFRNQIQILKSTDLETKVSVPVEIEQEQPPCENTEPKPE